ncbi:hypothetical protein ABIC63_000213 [Pseudacidovorax sp. 1753]|uniref:alginate O-acetyltransferase AlgF n=1 Tax=unclassified Pseudacidovorax TaxID=2620592 RepID=UPI001B6D3E9B|nr:alginate O-acetyltransferase AlgF [Pseudacidovorax sp.]MBP6893845.1 alginate O-acetyltransferase AlgF [Pseudacidovorax sp.]
MKPLAFLLRALVLPAVSAFVTLPAQAQDGALSQLYAARPPAGSSFVRVVNPTTETLLVQVADGPAQRIGPQTPATSYAIVAGGRPFAVQVGGKKSATLEVQPDRFGTWVLRREGSAYAFTAIDDTGDVPDALKAELRFYNLVPGCAKAQLQIAPAGTPVVRDVAPMAAGARSVNPVQAQLAAACGGATSAAQALPALQAGDHLSLFMTGTADKPVLTMQPARTDTFKR